MRMKMKRVFRRNQIIITTLAIMIAAAGYLNYAGKSDLPGADTYEAGATKISDSDIYSENQAVSGSVADGEYEEIASLDDPGEGDPLIDTAPFIPALTPAGEVHPITALRYERADNLAELAESILDRGQTTPILVREDRDRFVLVEGLHRLEACKSLGEETILAFLVQARRH